MFAGIFVFPWLTLILHVWSLPATGAAVRRFRLPDATRRNHAPEHATVRFLRKRYGGRYRLSGHSEEDSLVTTQAIGLVLMAALTVIIVVLAPEPVDVAIALGVILALSALLWYPLSTRLQRRRMLLMDFRDATIRSIDPILEAGPFERHPVRFVRTQVLLRESRGAGPRPGRR